METYISVGSRMENKMGRGCPSMLMGLGISVSERMEDETVKGLKHGRMVQSMREIISTE